MARTRASTVSGTQPSGPPVIRDLPRHDAEALLKRNHVGRMAYTFHDRVDIVPITYSYSNGWLYGRTSHSTKLEILAHHPWVAFEVDEAEGLFDWRSVVVRGQFEVIPADLRGPYAVAYTQAVNLLREIIPDAWTAQDPIAFRNVLFRIHIDEISGRESRTPREQRAAD